MKQNFCLMQSDMASTKIGRFSSWVSPFLITTFVNHWNERIIQSSYSKHLSYAGSYLPLTGLILFCFMAFPDAVHASDSDARVEDKTIFQRIDAITQDEIDNRGEYFSPAGQNMTQYIDAISRIKACLSNYPATPITCHNIVENEIRCEKLIDSECYEIQSLAWFAYLDHYGSIIDRYVEQKMNKYIDSESSVKIPIARIRESEQKWITYMTSYCEDSANIILNVEPQLYYNQVYRDCIKRIISYRVNELRNIAFTIAYNQSIAEDGKVK